MPQPKSKRQKLLSSSRPRAPASSTLSKASLSSQTTRSVIRTHHTLQKQLSQALTSNDSERARDLEERLEENGGLKLYQQASTQGQSRDRGGDTSRVLVDWLREGGTLNRSSSSKPVKTKDIGGTTVATAATTAIERASRSAATDPFANRGALRILEVGALSPNNALNIPGAMKVRRIDLRSQHPEIEERDFMQLNPKQEWDGEVGYDVLSLSLVVNFVGDAKERGEMLRHTTSFLRRPVTLKGDADRSSERREARQAEAHDESRSEDETAGARPATGGKADVDDLLPALFLVLPLPCVDNSRYLTEEHLTAIMHSLGYVKTRAKRTAKLWYSLWRLDFPQPRAGNSWGGTGNPSGRVSRGRGRGKGLSEETDREEGALRDEAERGRGRRRRFKKEELRKGKDRNNFCIVLDDGGRAQSHRQDD